MTQTPMIDCIQMQILMTYMKYRLEANGCAFEIKNTTVNEAAINECAYNMFGAGTRLSTSGEISSDS